MKTILVTGGAGFIGSNFIKYMLEKYPNYRIINIDSLTYAGNLENLKSVSSNPNYKFYKLDIRDREGLSEIFKAYDIDLLVNFAAESHVDRSIEEPDVFFTTNIIGTQVLLDLARLHWKINPSDNYCSRYKEGVKFLQISTDEVYGSLGKDGLFTEKSPLEPSSPYSASKASGDLIVGSYYKTYNMPVNITRSSNNYGPYQFPEKLIPLIINNSLKEKELPIYGDGMQIRDWIFVSDHCRAIDMVLHKGIDGEVYNIGASTEITNIDIVRYILRILGKSETLIKYVKDRLGHDKRYALDSSKIRSQLGWEPVYSFEEAIGETVKWYSENRQWLCHLDQKEKNK